jgi:hypothetical protein
MNRAVAAPAHKVIKMMQGRVGIMPEKGRFVRLSEK